MSATKTVLITSGGEWNDASADLLDLPESTPGMEVLYAEYEGWLGKHPGFNGHGYKTFVEYLKEFYGAKNSECEQFSE